ncbi:bifunctional 4-hydroxy-2-oxoglutarate aldolase/2-dehydro-3-deoxy-phosphogluconate aldolase [Haloferax namakaokahaiae]|uniref:Bifunctional 4-hydroxy-2-oxoglutarate aldolase/2-dehydro-3-deoxy-phosphogluconate aldolase n=1 Tax=Haloferax namakaokahaiae TaxID=1748331 RepID=A0ABD5ZJV5_9EURY
MSTDVLKRITETGVVAIIRGTNPDSVIETIDALKRGGVSVVEVTANTDGVLRMLRDVRSSFTSNEVVVGAGTVLDSETARTTMLAGAEFLVTPSFDEGTIRAANRYGVPSIVGISTATEAVDAYETGADMVKVFPASTLGPQFVSALQGPLGFIPMVPTGGMTLDDVNAFVDAGATAIGVGSSIIDTKAVETTDYEILTSNARQFIQAVDAARDS